MLNNKRFWSPFFVFIFVLLLNMNPAGAVEPVFWPDNPSCADIGYSSASDFDFKPQPEPPPSGTYLFPDGVHSVEIFSDVTHFDWVSDLGIDAVIVKGGNGANVYTYDPESFGDTGLHPPVNSSNNYAAISHINFCYDYEVDVSKTAVTTYTRTFDWDIDKSVTPAEWSLFDGDSGSSVYTVALTRTVTDSDFAVAGTIVIENNTPLDATIEAVGDIMTGGIAALVTCADSLPLTLLPGESMECGYSSDLPDATARVNTANVITSGVVGGNQGSADVIFGDPSTVIGPEAVNVDDSNGESWSFSDSGSVSYATNFSCDAVDYINNYGTYTHANTATIFETKEFDSEQVTIHCYQLEVAKDASTSVDRTYIWDVEKWAEDGNGNLAEELTLSPGQEIEIFYSVDVDVVDYSDSNFMVKGTIDVENPAPISARILSVNDVLPEAIALNVDCPVAFPFDLAGEGSFSCFYTATVGNGTTSTNTAIVHLQNFAYALSGMTPIGVSAFSGTAEVNFSDPAINDPIDECVEVSDTFAEALGTLCFGNDDLPAVFTYSRWIGPYFNPDDCGQNLVVNTASIITGDTGITDESTWDIPVHVPCETGCTLTPGYWKTHSLYGPAPYDETWTSIGEDTPFFYAEGDDAVIQSYYEVLWTPPQGGNAYYILAHAYIAAVLNGINGASAPPEVTVVIDDVQQWFDDPQHTPDYAKELKGKKGASQRAQLLMWALLLDNYNNGLIGPGHCSE